MKNNNPILCYLGLTIVNREVLKRVHFYRKKLAGQNTFEQYSVKQQEVHITLVPPFFTDYKTASAINFGCMASTLQSTSIINMATFSIQHLSSMNFEGETILHFPVQVYKEEEGVLFEDFGNRVNALRKQIQKLGAEIRLPVPSTYTPHISVSTKGLTHDAQMIQEESKNDEVLHFNASYPTLYVKYKGVGYRDLTVSPEEL